MSKHPTTKYLRYTLLLLGLFGLLLTACSPTQQTVSFMVSGDPAERQAYLDLVAAFEEAHPDISIEVTHI
ncbi:MAG: hypothetical protein KC434_11280, partial [Anaerolineales bacterium]|nr:hypothetical protein [Anaerolineales bacterium]